MKPVGFIVMESCETYEQALVLMTGTGLPNGGILNWADHRRRDCRAVFTVRADAVAAITRTEHYRLAFGLTGAHSLPEKKFCSVVPVCTVPASQEGGK